jgi:ABC-type proline/glycine betaine transport system substrate-binding protein
MDSNQAKAAKQEEMLAEIIARMDANTKEIMAEINTKMDNNQAEMRSIVDEWMTDIKDA